MRTIKASEVVKGMRVQFDVDRDGVTYTLTSSVMETPHVGVANCDIHLGTGGRVIETLPHDHPVTVLAEPEPEWVEGAWYWTQTKHAAGPTLRMRSGGFWRAAGQTTNEYRLVTKDITVLGRVLIVDWPGDQLAKDLTDGASISRDWESLADLVADAIRTQGGVR